MISLVRKTTTINDRNEIQKVMISLDVSIRVITDMSFGVCLIRRYEYGWEKVRELYTHLLHLGVVVVVGYIAARVTWSSGFLKLDERQVIWYRDGGLLFLLVFFLLVLYTARLFAFFLLSRLGFGILYFGLVFVFYCSR